MQIVSPGVYSREIDLSLYVPALGQTIFGVVGTASKGPTNEITLITDEASLIDTFGKPSSLHLGVYAALRYLRKGKQLKFVRVAQYDASASADFMNAANTVVAMTVTAVSTGSWANDITVVISAGVGVDPETNSPTYKIVVYSNGATAEVFDLVVFDPNYADAINYITTRINGVSSYISVVPVAGQSDLLVGENEDLSGGDDGAPADDADYVGTAAVSGLVPATGLQLFADAESVDVNALAVPDVAHNAIIVELISLCEDRGDCMALIDVPYGKSVQEAVAWSNGLGTGPDDPSSAISSSYAAIFYPWVYVYDGYSGAYVWVPPSGHIAGVFAYTDEVSDLWFAPAGLNRGMLQDVIDIEHSASQGERDYMYANGNVVNPIISYPGQGIVIWGQRTAKRTASALDRINVRRLMLYTRKAISTVVRALIFEPNDQTTWMIFKNLVEPTLDDIKARRGLYDYKVICDATTNTPAVINRNELKGKILLKPTKAAEMISIDFVILNNEASFSEF